MPPEWRVGSQYALRDFYYRDGAMRTDAR